MLQADFLDAINDSMKTVRNLLGSPSSTGVGRVGGTRNAKDEYWEGLNFPVGLEEYLPRGFQDEAWDFLVVNPEDFYKIFPYQFAIESQAGDFVFTLPIPPDSIQTKMVVASEATPTIGGMVEETSMTKLWMISLSGTTGLAVSRSGSGDRWKDTKTAADKFRSALETTGLLSGAAAKVNAIAGKVGNVVNAFSNITNPASAVAAVSGGIQAALQPNLPYLNSSVDRNSNGFSEIHRLQKFLYMYTVLHEKDPSGTSLYFRNIKDRMLFRCVVKDFNIQKSVNEPFLYRYRISLKCWNPSGDPDGGGNGAEINRFGPNGDLKSTNTLTAKGAYGSAKTLASNIKKSLKL